MLEKYKKLKSMLQEKYNISLSDDINEIGEQIEIVFDEYAITISVENNSFQVIIDRYNEADNRWEAVEEKHYKIVNPTYKFIESWIKNN